MHWLSMNLAKESLMEERKTKDAEKERLELDGQTVDTYLASLFSFTGLSEKKSKIDLGSQSLEAGCCVGEGQISSRKVSISSAHCLGKVVHPKEENCGYSNCKHKETKSSGKERSASFEKNIKCKVHKTEPRLPPHFLPPSSPPSRASCCSVNLLDSVSDLTSLEDTLSHQVKQKLLALKMQEGDVGYNDGTHSTISPCLTENSQLSSFSESDDSEVMNPPNFFPYACNSAPESDISTGGTMTSDYYTPFQSFHEYPYCKSPPITSEDNNISSRASCSASCSVRRTSSAPSFLICSSTQLFQCLMDESSSISDFKAYLQKMAEEAKNDIHTPDTLKFSKMSDEAKNDIHTPETLKFPIMSEDASHTPETPKFSRMSEESKYNIHSPETLKFPIMSEDANHTTETMKFPKTLEESKYDSHTPKTSKYPEIGDDEEVRSLRYFLGGFMPLEDLNSQYGEEYSFDSNFRDGEGSNESEPEVILSTTEVDRDSEFEDSTMHRTYQDIPLGELLDRLYPVNIQTDKERALCSPHNDGDGMDAQVHLCDGYTDAEPLTTSTDDDHANSETEETTCVAHFNEDDGTSKTYSVNNSDIEMLHLDANIDESIGNNDTNSHMFSTADDGYYESSLLPLKHLDDSTRDGSDILGKTYSVNDDEDSVFTIPSLPLPSDHDTPEESYLTIPLFGTSKDENDTAVQSQTSMELARESNFTISSFPQGSSEYQYFTASNISSSNNSIMPIPSLPQKCESNQNISGSEPTLDTSSSADTKDSFFTIPSLPLKTICNDSISNNSATATITASDAADTSFPSETVDSFEEGEPSKIAFIAGSNDISVESAIPSLSLKIKAWSSSDNGNNPTRPHKTTSTPANLGSTSVNSNAIAITVTKPPKLVSNSPNAKLSEADSGSSANSSLQYVTEFLESSHDSLAKSVHSLCQRAIIEQSNISLDLILPIRKLSPMKDEAAPFNRLQSHLAKLQFNSSTVYTSELQDEVERESKVLDEELK